MFKQLKRKMLILNLSLLTILLIAVFMTLYISNYNQIQKQIDLDLARVMNNLRESFVDDGQLPPPINTEDAPFNPNQSMSFVIVTDYDGDVIQSWFSFDSEDDYLVALDLALDNEGQFDLYGSRFAYRKDILANEVVYGFIDISNEQAFLTNMVWTFVFVFLGAFVIVYLISNYFSNQSINQIKEAFNKQKEFIANASHELKTPLAIISTNADILIQEHDDNQWLNNIKYETERMNKLTKDLLYLTKMSEQTPYEIVLSKTNISELVESSILGFEALAYDKDIDMAYKIEPDVYSMVDKDQISQVCHILLDNAIKYTNQNGFIKIVLETNHNQVIYSVMNSGQGISKDSINHIFDRFYMGDKSRTLNEKSYGLGLSIAQTIIDNHQGKITCVSEEGSFTKFSVRLKKIQA